MNKRGQEEMIGFALIVVLVAVILLIFLGFSLRNNTKEAVESYEAESFLQAMLQHTTDCGNNRESHLDVQKLISECIKEKECVDGRDSCEVLESTLKEIVEQSWDVEGDRPVKGYKLDIILGNQGVIPSIKKGEGTNNYKGASQVFSPSAGSYEILFKVYY